MGMDWPPAPRTLARLLTAAVFVAGLGVFYCTTISVVWSATELQDQHRPVVAAAVLITVITLALGSALRVQARSVRGALGRSKAPQIRTPFVVRDDRVVEISRIIKILVADRDGSDQLDVEQAVRHHWKLPRVYQDRLVQLLAGEQYIDQQMLVSIIDGLDARAVDPPKDERRAAVHEAGHAVVSLLTEHGTEFQGASIEAHRQSGGITLGSAKSAVCSRDDVVALIAIDLGGVEAERLILGQTSNGAADDLTQTTALAREFARCDGSSHQDWIREGRVVAVHLLTTHRDGLARIAAHLEEHRAIGAIAARRLLDTLASRSGAGAEGRLNSGANLAD